MKITLTRLEDNSPFEIDLGRILTIRMDEKGHSVIEAFIDNETQTITTVEKPFQVRQKMDALKGGHL